jgi:hypothetical protein
MQGTVISSTIVKDTAGKTIIDARPEDRVEGNGTSVITKLWRNGVQKWQGYGYMNWTHVRIDGAPPPPPPVDPPADKFARRLKVIDTDTGTSADYVKVD